MSEEKQSKKSAGRRFFPRSVAIRWALSYLIILSICTGMSLCNHYNSKKIILEEIDSLARLSMESIENQVDTTLDNLSSIAYAIVSDPKVNELVSGGSGEQALHARKCMELFRQYRYANADLSVLCLDSSNNMLISYETANQIDMLFPVVQQSIVRDISQDSWTKRLQDAALQQRYVLADDLSYTNAGKTSFVYAMRSYGLGLPGSSSYVNLYVSTPCDNLPGLANNATFLITDTSGTILWKWNPMKLDLSVTENRLVFTENENILTLDVPSIDTSYICSYMRSSANPQWYLVQVLPSAQYYAHTHALLRTLLISLVLTTLFSMVLTGWFVYANYKPLNELLHLTEADKKTSDTETDQRSENEYDVIRQAVKHLQTENQNMVEQQNLLRKRLEDKYLLSMLIGREENKPDKLVEAHVHQLIDGKTIQILIARYEPNERDSNQNLSYRETMGYAAQNILEELLRDSVGSFCLWDGRYQVYLIAGECTQPMDAVFEKFYTIFDSAFPQVMTAAIGDPVSDRSQISIAYAEALSAMQYMEDAGGNGLIYTRDLRSKGSSSEEAVQAANEVQIHKLVDAIRGGDIDQAHWAMRNLFDLTRSMALPEPMLHHSLIALLNEPVSAFLHAFDLEAGEQSVLNEKIGKLNEIRNTSDLCDAMMELVRHLCQMVQRYSSERTVGFAEQIEAYIDKNYTDPNLNVTAIADIMGVSSKTVSTRFRQATGEGILDYIARVRVNHAKTIAQDQQLSVEKISEMVGYTSVKTFRRAFSKVEGATPGRFFQKNSMHSNEE